VITDEAPAVPADCWAARRRMLTDEAIAFHEAGHVIVAYDFKWWIGHGGVRLGAWAHARFGNQLSDNTLTARVSVYMAGLLAEEKFLGLQLRIEDAVIDEIRAVRAGREEFMVPFPTDLRGVALALIDDDPTIADCEARAAVAYCRARTTALLAAPAAWGSVERITAALLRRGRLTRRQMESLLGRAA
jgi:hypothetical protein